MCCQQFINNCRFLYLPWTVNHIPCLSCKLSYQLVPHLPLPPESVSQCRMVIARLLSGVVAISCIRPLRRLLQSLLLLHNDITTQPPSMRKTKAEQHLREGDKLPPVDVRSFEFPLASHRQSCNIAPFGKRPAGNWKVKNRY